MSAILLVDADAERRQDIREDFQNHTKWTLLDVASAGEGRKIFTERAIDLVILDLDSAGAPGEELFDWIRADEALVPVILLTSDEMDEQQCVEALVMGSASYVPLSSVARDLVVTVERLLGLSGCRRRHARLSETLIATETAFRIEDNDLSLIPVLVGRLKATRSDGNDNNSSCTPRAGRRAISCRETVPRHICRPTDNGVCDRRLDRQAPGHLRFCRTHHGSHPRMLDQTTMNGQSAKPSPVKGVGQNVAGLMHDLLSLGELQCQLIAVDLQEAMSRSKWPMVLILAAVLLALGTMPVVLLGIGWALVHVGGLTEGTAFLLVSLVALAIVGVTVWWSLHRIKSALCVLTRSRQELNENVCWIKQALRQQGTTAELFRQRV